MEIWKDVKGYEGLYKISNLGRVNRLMHVRKLYHIHLKKFIPVVFKDRILKSNMNKGYLGITLHINGSKKQCYIHRLIAEAFIPNPENKPEVNHKNGIKSDNRIENLEWVTHKENMIHAGRMGVMNGGIGENNGMSKLNEFQVRVIRKSSGLTHLELSKVFNVHRTTVSYIINGRLWPHVAGKYFLHEGYMMPT